MWVASRGDSAKYSARKASTRAERSLMPRV
jgi:hypothetical protein